MIKMTRIPMTTAGEKKLREELHYLKMVQRPKIVAAIAVAREHGDLKENAEYHAAREQQSFNEGRIRELETKLSYAEVIDITRINDCSKVVFGATIGLLNIETGEKRIYQIVGEDEADIKEAKLSISSPIARALIGKELEDYVEVNTPSGIQEFEIVSIQYI
jgi:transcription elongation factor GreA